MNALRPWLDVEVPTDVLAIPGMLAPEESRYYVWLAQHHYTGKGAIVDLGSWLGKSAASLAVGLERSGAKGRVLAYDRFVWEPDYMTSVHDLGLPRGADFMPAFRRLTAAHASRIEAIQQDLTDYRWTGGPIEILVVDAAKSWKLTNSILRGFADGIVPDVTRVVWQDFRYEECYWLPLVTDTRPDLWQEIEATDTGWGVTFTTKRGLYGTGGIAADYDLTSFSWQQAKQALTARMVRDTAAGRHNLRRSLLRWAAIDGPRDEVERVRAELVADKEFPIAAADLARLTDLSCLIDPAWHAYSAGDFARASALAQRCLATAADPISALRVLAMCCLRTGEAKLAHEFASRLESFDAGGWNTGMICAETALAMRDLGGAAARLSALSVPGVVPDAYRPWLDALVQRLALARSR